MKLLQKKYNNDIVWTRATSRNQSTPNLQAIKILDAHNKEVRTIYDDINASSSQKNRNQLYEVIRKISKETVKELRVYKIK